MKIEVRKIRKTNRRGESGYALVGMIGVMLFAMILMTATAPTLKYELQREKEEEMLYRGQQVADALGKYRGFRNGQYPTDLKEMVEGVSVGVKKMHLLRPSALCDPMTPCDPGTVNWKLVHQGNPLVKELYEAYTSMQQSGLSVPPDNGELRRQAQLAGVQLPGQEADTKLDGEAMAPTDSANDSELNKRPIIGVVSRKAGEMFRNYYGIEQYDHSLFFAGLGVVASGFSPGVRLPGNAVGFQSGGPPASNTGTTPTNAPSAPCPFGGSFINGRCSGGMYPGPYQRPTPAPSTP